MANILELRGVSYSHPGASTKILQQVDFSTSDKRVGLIGPNGCGKTTLLHLLVGLNQPEEGQLLFYGQAVEDEKNLRALRKEVGFLFQNSDDQLFSPTVIEDVAFGPLNLGLSPEEAVERGIATLEQLGLLGFENRNTHHLSGGEKKLVALATILAMQPKMLLLDEPTNNLDPKTRSRLIDILQDLDLHKIIVSHDWDFLSHTTSTLYQLENGKLHRCDDDHIHVHRHVHKAGAHLH